MNYWKLGCRWGEGKPPSYYEFMKTESIVIGVNERLYSKGDFIVITDGFTVLAIAEVIEKPKSVITKNEYKKACEELKIPYIDSVNYAEAEWYELDKTEKFEYKLQTGIRKIQKSEIIESAAKIIKKHQFVKTMNRQINLLKFKHQIILQGAPGTGKTYTAKELAYSFVFGENLSSKSDERKKQLAELEKSEQFKFIQFHPAYSYEDFVRGIVAESNGSQIEYKTKDKILAEFAKIALKNYQDSQKTPEILSEEKRLQLLFEEFKGSVQTAIESNGKYEINSIIHIIAVNETNFRIKGDTWRHAILMKFEDILKLQKEGMTDSYNDGQYMKHLINTSHDGQNYGPTYSMMLRKLQEFMKDKKPPVTIEEQVELKNYVLIIDEINRANLPSVLGELIYALEYRGESVDSMYDIDGDRSLVLPENLYIIGTMNTADRSVGHIDYAIRRRFAFVDIGADETVIGLPKAKALFNEVRAIFKEHIASDFELKDIELGHSYYLAKEESELPMKLEYEIKPLLREYVKDGILLSEAKDKIEALNV
jgi:5-methylcytosine-specific restriction enzyme B